MPWKEQTTMSERKKFIHSVIQPGSNMSQLCREFGISRKTGYKWLHRYQQGGVANLEDRSRRPHRSPKRTEPHIERVVLSVRRQHPVWGGRKIRQRMVNLGYEQVPSASTITAILARHNQIDPEESQKRKAYQRFEMAQPNQLWQMDFKGHFPIAGQRCYPLTILDDHSRYLMGLQACKSPDTETVRECLTAVFRQYGLPDCFLTDNSGPWGPNSGQPYYTRLNVWMFRLNIQLIHSRPFHPQTLGKDERLHRTLKAEVIQLHDFQNFSVCQNTFSAWRQTYNHIRPHEALELEVPAARYRPSQRLFPEKLPPIEYPSSDQVRKVSVIGKISFHGKRYRVGNAFCGYPVAVRETESDGVFDVFFCQQKTKTFSLLR